MLGLALAGFLVGGLVGEAGIAEGVQEERLCLARLMISSLVIDDVSDRFRRGSCGEMAIEVFVVDSSVLWRVVGEVCLAQKASLNRVLSFPWRVIHTNMQRVQGLSVLYDVSCHVNHCVLLPDGLHELFEWTPAAVAR